MLALAQNDISLTSWALRAWMQNVPNWDRHTIVGTSQEVFKDYLRLTSVNITPSLSRDVHVHDFPLFIGT